MAPRGLVRWTALSGAILLLVMAPAFAAAATLRVAATGVDAAGCGPVAAPCRTIDQAIAHAAPGDTIVVASGRYPRAVVSRSVTLVSSRGAGATVVDAEGSDFAIDVSANDVTIGRRAAGFTVIGASHSGIHASDVSRVAIAGNDASGNHNGIFIDGWDVGDIEVSGNVASHNARVGIYAWRAAGVEIVGNLVEGNGEYGILANLFSGTIRGNTVTANASAGIYAVLGDGMAVRDNIVVANGTGMGITGNVLVTHNSILGNRWGGLVAGGFQGSPGYLTANRNNFYDNGQCSIALYRSGHVDGRNNFWGASGGTTVNSSCLGFSGAGGAIDTEPFLPREIPVSPIKPRL